MAIIHFFECDIIVKSDASGDAIFGGIDRIGPTKYQAFDKGNCSVISPARPAAARSDIANSFYSIITNLTYKDYSERAGSWSNSKKSRLLKRKELTEKNVISSASSGNFTSPTSEFLSTIFEGKMRPGRKRSKPEALGIQSNPENQALSSASVGDSMTAEDSILHTDSVD